LGLSRQLIADARFGAHGFRYCGSLLGPATGLFPSQRELLDTALGLADAVTEEFGLIGLNGIDFIAQNGVPYPIEVNPRYSASMELVERARGFSLFEVHAGACHGTLPSRASQMEGVEGKAIVYARRDVILGDTRPWLALRSVADVPHPGERIRKGRPICTVFASGRDVASCHRILVRRAARVYRAVEASRRGAA
jgi:predicted ATP-grasp superfamily ATP-dependent carboligase